VIDIVEGRVSASRSCIRFNASRALTAAELTLDVPKQTHYRRLMSLTPLQKQLQEAGVSAPGQDSSGVAGYDVLLVQVYIQDLNYPGEQLLPDFKHSQLSHHNVLILQCAFPQNEDSYYPIMFLNIC
jgi:hypothetical protein